MVQSTVGPPAHAELQLRTNAERLASSGLEFGELRLHLLEVHLGDVPHLDAVPLWLVHQADQVAHLFDGEPEISAPANERQSRMAESS